MTERITDRGALYLAHDLLRDGRVDETLELIERAVAKPLSKSKGLAVRIQHLIDELEEGGTGFWSRRTVDADALRKILRGGGK